MRYTHNVFYRLLTKSRSTEASWHADYRDTAYIYIGGFSFDLSEGDVVAIFSQVGEPVYINLVRDKESGKSKGFAFLKYEDQRSTDLAVDNLGGATVLGRVLKVDHTRYKRKEEDTGIDLNEEAHGKNGNGNAVVDSEDEQEARPMLKEERELATLIADQDDEDPMKSYLVSEKKEEVSRALAKLKKERSKVAQEKWRHRHGHKHRSRRDDGGQSPEDERRKRHKHSWKRSRSPR